LQLDETLCPFSALCRQDERKKHKLGFGGGCQGGVTAGTWDCGSLFASSVTRARLYLAALLYLVPTLVSTFIYLTVRLRTLIYENEHR
jgi:hypothetical protein